MSLRCDAGKGCHFSRTAPALQECVQKCTELRKKWVLLTPKELSTFSGELWLDVGPVGGGFQYLLFSIFFNHRNGSMIPSDHNWCLGLATSHQPPATSQLSASPGAFRVPVRSKTVDVPFAWENLVAYSTQHRWAVVAWGHEGTFRCHQTWGKVQV